MSRRHGGCGCDDEEIIVKCNDSLTWGQWIALMIFYLFVIEGFISCTRTAPPPPSTEIRK